MRPSTTRASHRGGSSVSGTWRCGAWPDGHREPRTQLKLRFLEPIAAVPHPAGTGKGGVGKPCGMPALQQGAVVPSPPYSTLGRSLAEMGTAPPEGHESGATCVLGEQ